MLTNLEQGISAVLGRKKKITPQYTNRLSSLDGPCDRRLFYERAAWDKRQSTPDSLQGIFETGSDLEPILKRIQAEIGAECSPQWRIVADQMPVNDNLLKKYQISGTIDGILQVRHPGVERWVSVAVADTKTMSGNVYNRIETYDDLSRYPWTRGYRGQLMGYALGVGLEQCVIIAHNKNNLYDFRLIEFPLDLEYMEGLLQRAERINTAVADGVAPEGINDPNECQRCPFFSYCAPPLTVGSGLVIGDMPELEVILEEMETLRADSEHYEELKAERDAILDRCRGQNLAVGRFMVTWKRIEGTRKPSPGGAYTQWRKTITAS